MAVHQPKIAGGPAKLEAAVSAVDPAEFPQRSHKRRHAGLNFRVSLGPRHQHTDPPHSIGLLRACRERPQHRRAAKSGQQFPPFHGDCHTPLPCELRKWNDTTPRACSLHVQRGSMLGASTSVFGFNSSRRQLFANAAIVASRNRFRILAQRYAGGGSVTTQDQFSKKILESAVY